MKTTWVSHLAPELIRNLLQLRLLDARLRWPPNAQALSLIRFRDHVEMNMRNDLMGGTTVVLQDVVVLGAGCRSQLFADRLSRRNERNVSVALD